MASQVQVSSSACKASALETAGKAFADCALGSVGD